MDKRMGKRLAGIVLLSMAALFGMGVALSVTTIPTITVTGVRPASDGGYIICTGYACADVLDALSTPPFFEWEFQQIWDQDPIDRGAFCSAMRAKAPANCNVSNPPSSPGIGNWQPDGCGSGGWDNVKAQAGAYMAFGGNYSGDLDAPHAGVSFLPACNNHDRCWGAAGNKGVCDEVFLNEMRGACAASAGGGVGVCNGFASAWHSAVATTPTAQQNYNDDVGNRKCGLYSKDLKDNGCS